jgi:hypothetical protein
MDHLSAVAIAFLAGLLDLLEFLPRLFTPPNVLSDDTPRVCGY